MAGTGLLSGLGLVKDAIEADLVAALAQIAGGAAPPAPPEQPEQP